MGWPQRKKPPRMGVRDERPRYYAHMRWVRGFACMVPYCDTGTKVIFHHVREAGDAGMSDKDDRYGVALCSTHHDEGHAIGWKTFAAKYVVDLMKLAEWFERNSKHREWLETENA